MQDFRQLKVWVRANDLAPQVRKLTGTFPKTGYRSLREQIIAAAESIPFNIAEGCGANTQKEFARYLDIAVKSACELEAELQLSLKYGIIAERDGAKCSDEVVEIRRMLRGLRKRVLAPRSG
jgi:four helix bundle protein